MYTILMTDTKQLKTTVKTNLFQREKLADKIQFLLPVEYDDLTISDCTVVLKYLDPQDAPHSEILERDEELFKGKNRYFLPVDTVMTRYAGTVKARISVIKADLDEGTEKVLHSSQAYITILPLEDYFSFSPDTQLELIDQMVGRIDAKIQELNETTEYLQESKADGIIRSDTDNTSTLQLTSNGEPIGTAVSILQDEVPSLDLDDESGSGSSSNTDDVVEF